ncbi:MAG TPA: hypothetical protein PL041_06005 [Melioribacteraceae bacterium]|nr:hypothetical protein [Melioribacteraceae bacterium]
MIYVVSAVVIVIFVILLFEYRIKNPDTVILYEKNDNIKMRTGRYYPRHFSLALPKTTYTLTPLIEATAKGNLDIKVKLSVTVAANINNLPALIKIGGWNANAISKAAKELELILEGKVKSFTENFGIEELSSEKINANLNINTKDSGEKLGLEIISLIVQSYEPSDKKISEALKQQESARIAEQTETLNQKARLASVKIKISADEEIAKMESELELKKLQLKNEELLKEATIAQKRTEEELKRKQLQLEYESKELELLKNYPELLILTPQAARLAEASQSLKNARTVVNLSQQELAQVPELIGMFQNFLKNNLKPSGNSDNKSNQ